MPRKRKVEETVKEEMSSSPKEGENGEVIVKTERLPSQEEKDGSISDSPEDDGNSGRTLRPRKNTCYVEREEASPASEQEMRRTFGFKGKRKKRRAGLSFEKGPGRIEKEDQAVEPKNSESVEGGGGEKPATSGEVVPLQKKKKRRPKPSQLAVFKAIIGTDVSCLASSTPSKDTKPLVPLKPDEQQNENKSPENDGKEPAPSVSVQNKTEALGSSKPVRKPGPRRRPKLPTEGGRKVSTVKKDTLTESQVEAVVKVEVPTPDEANLSSAPADSKENVRSKPSVKTTKQQKKPCTVKTEGTEGSPGREVKPVVKPKKRKARATPAPEKDPDPAEPKGENPGEKSEKVQTPGAATATAATILKKKKRRPKVTTPKDVKVSTEATTTTDASAASAGTDEKPADVKPEPDQKDSKTEEKGQDAPSSGGPKDGGEVPGPSKSATSSTFPPKKTLFRGRRSKLSARTGRKEVIYTEEPINPEDLKGFEHVELYVTPPGIKLPKFWDSEDEISEDENSDNFRRIMCGFGTNCRIHEVIRPTSEIVRRMKELQNTFGSSKTIPLFQKDGSTGPEPSLEEVEFEVTPEGKQPILWHSDPKYFQYANNVP